MERPGSVGHESRRGASVAVREVTLKPGHFLVREGGWNLEILDDGSLRITDPNGQELGAPPTYVIGADEPGIMERNQARGLNIDDMTGIPRWYGESLDLDHAITGLLSLRDPSFATYQLAPACRPAEARCPGEHDSVDEACQSSVDG